MSVFLATDTITHLRSRQNANYKAFKALTQDAAAWKTQGRLWLEGEHLCSAWLEARQQGYATAQGWTLEAVVLAQSRYACAKRRALTLPQDLGRAARVWVLEDALFASLSPLPSAAGWALVLQQRHHSKTQGAAMPQAGVPTVILDGLQDPGNAGSILRSSKAMGFVQVLATQGSVALWSPKVLRAAMGAHFGLHIVEGLSLQADAAWVQTLQLPFLLTLPHQGSALHTCRLPFPCAWIFGHEGQGASPVWQGFATQAIRIAQPGGEESLNVAAAAAICLHASAAQKMA